MKNWIVKLVFLLCSASLLAFSSETQSKYFNWKGGDLNKRNVVRIDLKLLDEDLLNAITTDYAKNPLTFNLKAESIEQKMENITLWRAWKNSENDAELQVIFYVDTSTYFVVYIIQNKNIVDKFYLSSWNL